MVNTIQAGGDLVALQVTHQMHFGYSPRVENDDEFIADFGDALRKAFNKVNNLQLRSDGLTRELAVNPDSVDIHDVTIAAEKARLSLMLTKSIVDKITQGYRELINMR